MLLIGLTPNAGFVPCRSAQALITSLFWWVLVVQALLTQDSVTFDGRFYSVRDAAIEPRPKSPVPVWSAGGGSHTPGGGRDGGIAARVMNRILRHEGWLSG